MKPTNQHMRAIFLSHLIITGLDLLRIITRKKIKDRFPRYLFINHLPAALKKNKGSLAKDIAKAMFAAFIIREALKR
jgi:hypothetical protein